MKFLLAGALLLEEVVNSYGREGIDAIMNGAKEHFKESQQEKASGSKVWWRVSEMHLSVHMLTVRKLSCSRCRVWPKTCNTGFNILNYAEIHYLKINVGSCCHPIYLKVKKA